MNAYTIAQIKKLEPLSDKEYDLIREKGTVTGSFVFGGHDGYISDIDYIISNIDIIFEDLEKSDKVYVKENEYDGEGAFFSCYCRTGDNTFLNLLLFGNEVDFKTWKKATQLMIKIKQIKWMSKKFEDKKKRVAMFELLKKSFA